MRRREFLTLLSGCGAAAVWPLAARAQQTERMRRIGLLMGFAESDPAAQSEVAAFRGALTKLGWTEGSNLRIELRWGAGDANTIRTFRAWRTENRFLKWGGAGLAAVLATVVGFRLTAPNSPCALLQSACPLRVRNGIFAAGDWRTKTGLKTMSPRRDRQSETTTREKWPQKRPFC